MEASFTDNIVKLTDIFPDIDVARIATMLKEENNCLEGVVSRILEFSKEEDDEIVEVNALQKVSEEKEEEMKERVRELSSIPVDSGTLRNILSNVAARENKSSGEPNVLSFNRQDPARQRCTTKLNPKSLALNTRSNQSTDGPSCSREGKIPCRSCLNIIEHGKFNFGPFCGNIFHPNYRRL